VELLGRGARAEPHLPVKSNPQGISRRVRRDAKGRSTTARDLGYADTERIRQDPPDHAVIGVFEGNLRGGPFDEDLSTAAERLPINARGADAEVPLHDLIVGDHVVRERRRRDADEECERCCQ
jgi:hypothetical protein